MIALYLSSPTYAQSIGDRAIGLGGAYTALADDSSASWYNPAGLTHLSKTMITVSGNAYQYKSITYKDFMEFDDQQGHVINSDYKADAVNTYPSTIIYGMKLDALLWNQSIAFSVLVPKTEKSKGGISFSSFNDILTATFETEVDAKEYFIGPSYAIGNSDYSVGISALFRFYDRNYSFTLFEDTKVPNQIKYISAKIFDETYRHLSFMPSLGLQWHPASGYRIGLMARIPSIAIYGSTEVQRVETTAGSDEFNDKDEHNQIHTEEVLTAVQKIPWMGRIGVGYQIPDKFSTELSLQITGKVDSYLDRDPNLPRSSEAEHNLISSKLGLDLNLGAEYYLSDNYQIRAGIFTEFAHHAKFNSKTTPDSGNTAAGDHYEDRFGLSIGLGNITKKTKTSYTIQIVRGIGEAYGFLTKPPLDTSNIELNAPLHQKDIQVVETGYWEFAFIISGSI